MKKSLILAAALALVLGACGADHKAAAPTAAARATGRASAYTRAGSAAGH
jgi:hypothetical protein